MLYAVNVGRVSRKDKRLQNMNTTIQRKENLPVVTSSSANRVSYIPSRYNVKVQDEFGQWIIYNSFTGAVGAIPKDKEVDILPLLKGECLGPLEGEAKILEQKGFLVKRGIDETRRVSLMKQSRQSAKNLNLILMPTEECNFRCVYCYEAFARGQMRPNVRQGVKNLVSHMAPKLESLHISWFGGEPLREMEIVEEISTSLMNSCRSHGVSYSSNMTTNGYYLSPENLQKLAACEVRNFQITLDGCPEQHDAMRVLKGGGATFDRIWGNLKAARMVQERFSIKIRVNFNQQTLDQLSPFLSLLHSELKGDDRFSLFFRPVGNWGGPNDGNFQVCDKKPGEEASFEASRVAIGQGLRSEMVYPFLRPHGSVCYAADPKSFVVGADGTLYKCTVALDNENNKVGRLLPDGTMDLDQDRFALWVTSDDSDDPVCQSCFFRPPCQGSACPLVRIESGQRPCPPEKKMVKRALITVWENFKSFGKLGEAGYQASRD